MAPEVKFTAFGIPYVVEFANVTIRSQKSDSATTSVRPSVSPTPSVASVPSLSSSISPSPSTSASSILLSLPTAPPAPEMQSGDRKKAQSSSLFTLPRMKSVRSYFTSKSRSPSESRTRPLLLPIFSGSRSRSRSPSESPSLQKPHASTASLSQWFSIPAYDQSFPDPSPDPVIDPRFVPNSFTEAQEINPEGIYIQFSPEEYEDIMSSNISPRRRLARLRRSIANAVLDAGMESPDLPDRSNPLDALANVPALETQADNRQTWHADSRSLFSGTYGQMMTAFESAGLIVSPCPEDGFDGATRLGILFVAHHKSDGALELRKMTLWG